ncbi:MAG TPA: hypothetical protein VM369_00770 [Candidatus Binatia bacterium]|nr:hypothetical protein [Candidatus Binatia bacterium]
MHPLILAVTLSIGGITVETDSGRIGDVGSDPVVHKEQQSYRFDPKGSVEVSRMAGSVKVVAGAVDRVSFTYERKAATQQDHDCEVLKHEHSDRSLRIWLERKPDKACQLVRAVDLLTVTVPKGASVALSNIGDSASISGVEGMLRLESIGDAAVLDGVQQLQASSIGDSLKLAVTQVGAGGIRVDSVGDSVELSLPEQIDAELLIDSVDDEIRGPGLRVESPARYEATLGDGGRTIRISSVGDSVVIRGKALVGAQRIGD